MLLLAAVGLLAAVAVSSCYLFFSFLQMKTQQAMASHRWFQSRGESY
jgi:hypothetical protein